LEKKINSTKEKLLLKNLATISATKKRLAQANLKKTVLSLLSPALLNLKATNNNSLLKSASSNSTLFANSSMEITDAKRFTFAMSPDTIKALARRFTCAGSAKNVTNSLKTSIANTIISVNKEQLAPISIVNIFIYLMNFLLHMYLKKKIRTPLTFPIKSLNL